jgi:hypothetical protein
MSEELRKTVMDILDYGIARVEIRKPNNSGGIFPIWGKEVIDHAENAIEALIQAERIKAREETIAKLHQIYSKGDRSIYNALAELDTPKDKL